MAYQTGLATSAADLIDKLRVFGEAIGWVTNRSSGGTWYLRNASSTLFFAMEASTGQTAQHDNASGNIPAGRAIYFLSSTSYSTGTLLQQPGYAYRSPVSGRQLPALEFRAAPSGSDRYWFFGTTDYLHVVWRLPGSTYYHMQIGRLDKKGMNYAGGDYAQGTGVYWDSSGDWSSLWGEATYNRNGVRLGGFDVFTGLMEPVLGVGSGRYSAHPDNALVAASANAFTGDTILVPNRLLVLGSNSRRWYIGETPDFAVVSLMYCNPEQILTYGAEEWQVFPNFMKGNIGTANPNRTGSGDTGYAFRLRR